MATSQADQFLYSEDGWFSACFLNNNQLCLSLMLPLPTQPRNSHSAAQFSHSFITNILSYHFSRLSFKMYFTVCLTCLGKQMEEAFFPIVSSLPLFSTFYFILIQTKKRDVSQALPTVLQETTMVINLLKGILK